MRVRTLGETYLSGLLAPAPSTRGRDRCASPAAPGRGGDRMRLDTSAGFLGYPGRRRASRGSGRRREVGRETSAGRVRSSPTPPRAGPTRPARGLRLPGAVLVFAAV